MRIAVIGVGNGGQTMAGHLALMGHDVALYGRDMLTITELKRLGGIYLEGCISGFGRVNLITTDINAAVSDAEIIMVVTTANGHDAIAVQLAPLLRDGQVVVLNPGRTGGALVFRQALSRANFDKKIYVAEAQTLIYACRIQKTGYVNIIGVKSRVLLASYPSSDIKFVIEKINLLFDCFYAAKNILQTSLENIGAIFHPAVVLFNMAAIERGNMFYFYRDMTDSLGAFIEKLDAERCAVGKALGIDLIAAKEWISFAYDNVEGNTLCEKMKNNPAYYDILAPNNIYCRQITEDIPTGLIPIVELGKLVGVPTPLSVSLITLCSSILDIDFYKEGRTIERMGLHSISIKDL